MRTPPPDVAAYYATLASPQRETALTMRERILEVVPMSVEVMKYQMPTFIVDGEPVCGIMAHTKHVGYYPYSGSVLANFPDLMDRYGGTKSALHVPLGEPLSVTTIRKLVRARRQRNAG